MKLSPATKGRQFAKAGWPWLLLLALLATPAQAQWAALGGQLVEATQAGNLPEVKRLLSAGAKPDAHRLDGATSLMLAAEEGNLAVMQALLQGGASREARDSFGHTPLIWGAQAGQAEAVIKR